MRRVSQSTVAKISGFSIIEIMAPAKIRSRPSFGSKFGAARFVNGFLDLLSAAFISKSGLKPLHVFGRIGLLFAVVGGLVGLYFLGQPFIMLAFQHGSFHHDATLRTLRDGVDVLQTADTRADGRR